MGRKYIKFVTDEKLAKVNPRNKSLIDKYFNFKLMNLSDASKISYRSDFNQWLVFILDRYDNQYILDIINRDVDEMVDLIEDYIAFATSVLGNNERRIQRRMSSISSFFLFLRKKRKIKENPIDYLDRPSVHAGEKLQVKQTFLTKEQVESIRNGLKKLNDLQLELFFEFGLSTMARVTAISNVRIDQINFDEEEIDDVLEKEGYSVTLYPSPRAFELINKWLQHRKENNIKSDYLFIVKHSGNEWQKANATTLKSNWIKKVGKIIDVDLHCHDLRHSGSNLLYHSGMKLEAVSALLNHKSTEVTKKFYLQEDKQKIKDNKRKFEI
jgi:integrase/recombinase XerC